jgi:hypothetical protein
MLLRVINHVLKQDVSTRQEVRPSTVKHFFFSSNFQFTIIVYNFKINIIYYYDTVYKCKNCAMIYNMISYSTVLLVCISSTKKEILS